MSDKPSREDARKPSGLEEDIIGQIAVVVQLAFGIERLKLVLTSRRLVVAHMGKRSVSALASIPFLGKYGLDKMDKEKAASGGNHRHIPLAVDAILKADKDNFQIDYEDVISVDMRKSPTGLGIVILTKDDKFQFSTGEDQRRLENLLRRVLGTKLVISPRS